MQKLFLIRNYKPALVVIDVQEKLMDRMFNRDMIIKNLRTIVKGMQVLNFPLYLFEQNPRGIGTTMQEIIDVLDKYDPTVKMSFSAAVCENLTQDLGSPEDQRYILIAGVETHVCVLQTTLALREKGFRCGVLVDCTGSRSEMNHTTALQRMRDAGAELVTTEMVLFDLLESAEHPKFKEILRLIK